MKNIFKEILDNFMSGFKSGYKSAIHITSNMYRSQVKNSLSPFSSCFSTCVYWCLQSAGIMVESPDYVTKMLHSEHYKSWVKDNLGGWTYRKFKDRLQVLWLLQKKFMEDELEKAEINTAVIFNDDTNSQYILECLSNGSTIIVGTSPLYQGRQLGHIMLIVGYDYNTDEYIIDDPFGDFRVNYVTGFDKGNDLLFNKQEFDKIRGKLSLVIK